MIDALVRRNVFDFTEDEASLRKWDSTGKHWCPIAVSLRIYHAKHNNTFMYTRARTHTSAVLYDEDAKAAATDWTFDLPDTDASPINPVPFDATTKVIISNRLKTSANQNTTLRLNLSCLCAGRNHRGAGWDCWIFHPGLLSVVGNASYSGLWVYVYLCLYNCIRRSFPYKMESMHIALCRAQPCQSFTFKTSQTAAETAVDAQLDAELDTLKKKRKDKKRKKKTRSERKNKDEDGCVQGWA